VLTCRISLTLSPSPWELPRSHLVNWRRLWKPARSRHYIGCSDHAGYIFVGIVFADFTFVDSRGIDVLRILHVYPAPHLIALGILGLRGGTDLAIGSIHFNISASGVLRLPDPILLGPAAATAPSAATSTASSPTAADQSAATSSTTPATLIISASSSSSRGTASPSTMSVGSDDSRLSYLTSYHCIGCNARHERGSDAPPLVCGTKYSSDEESIGNSGDVIRLPAAQVA
jgi:hypothetical protein